MYTLAPHVHWNRKRWKPLCKAYQEPLRARRCLAAQSCAFACASKHRKIKPEPIECESHATRQLASEPLWTCCASAMQHHVCCNIVACLSASKTFRSQSRPNRGEEGRVWQCHGQECSKHHTFESTREEHFEGVLRQSCSATCVP